MNGTPNYAPHPVQPAYSANYNVRMPGLGMTVPNTGTPVMANGTPYVQPMYNMGNPMMPGMMHTGMPATTAAPSPVMMPSYVNPAAANLVKHSPPATMSSSANIGYVNPNYLKMMSPAMTPAPATATSTPSNNFGFF